VSRSLGNNIRCGHNKATCDKVHYIASVLLFVPLGACDDIPGHVWCAFRAIIDEHGIGAEGAHCLSSHRQSGRAKVLTVRGVDSHGGTRSRIEEHRGKGQQPEGAGDCPPAWLL
jgi:hypothetical protein